ncbi:MAG: 50S ribosomal protein L11 methyltransferase, partial [Lachnospiraceae bacterium]|nr:50S ribosomal protein L11 methyltransferase [Lachnospiraceae bacterium]
MEWNKYTIKTLTTAEDAISGALAELGIYGIEIEDNIPLSEEDKKTMFIDILPELPPDDGTAYISFYLQAGEEEDSSINNSGTE